MIMSPRALWGDQGFLGGKTQAQLLPLLLKFTSQYFGLECATFSDSYYTCKGVVRLVSSDNVEF